MEARRLFQQLVIAIEYCHSMGVVNRCAPLHGDGDAAGAAADMTWHWSACHSSASHC